MWQYSGNSPTAAMYSTVHRSDFRRVYPCIKPMVSLNRFWMSSILLIFLACSSSRIFALRSFSSGLRFFLPIVKTSDVVLLFYTTSEVYTKLGIVPLYSKLTKISFLFGRDRFSAEAARCGGVIRSLALWSPGPGAALACGWPQNDCCGSQPPHTPLPFCWAIVSANLNWPPFPEKNRFGINFPRRFFFALTHFITHLMPLPHNFIEKFPDGFGGFFVISLDFVPICGECVHTARVPNNGFYLTFR